MVLQHVGEDETSFMVMLAASMESAFFLFPLSTLSRFFEPGHDPTQDTEERSYYLVHALGNLKAKQRTLNPRVLGHFASDRQHAVVQAQDYCGRRHHHIGGPPHSETVSHPQWAR